MLNLTTIKSEINNALSQSHANDCTYDDLFSKSFNLNDDSMPSRVHINTLQEFETQLQEFIKQGQDFVIYLQHDDADLFAAECSSEEDDLDMVNLNTPRFTDGNIVIYIIID